MNQHPTTSIVQCQICHQQKHIGDAMPAELVHPPIVGTIRKKYPDWSASGFICFSDLNHCRAAYFEDILALDKGELSALEAEVVRSLREEEALLSKNVNVEFDRVLTFGERVADHVAEFGGSWGFIIGFGCFLLLWFVLNAAALFQHPLDPYPYILLNLMLSGLAALQAPIIMMSQNRQAAKDRLQAEHDYLVDLKAELEIRHLIAKLDQLVSHQWQRLLEIQRLQLELLQERPRPPAREADGEQ